MKCILFAVAFIAIFFLSSCAPARVGVGVSASSHPYYGRSYGRSYYSPRPYYSPYYYGHSRSYGRPRYGGHCRR